MFGYFSRRESFGGRRGFLYPDLLEHWNVIGKGRQLRVNSDL